MTDYVRRVIDSELDELMPILAAISIDGPKGVGKTSTALQRAASTMRLDEPASAELLRASPQQLDKALKPLLIDEWQRLPEVWDLVKRHVDRSQAGGQFLLTGSAAPVGASIHSGAGRIVSLRMRPLALSERGIGSPTVRLTDLFDGKAPISGSTEVALAEYVKEIVSSGFPGIRNLPARARRIQLDSYLARIVDKDFVEQGARLRRPQTLRAWMSAYAAATASTATYTTILDAATPGQSEKPTKDTILTYRDVLTQLWLLDPVEPWVATHNDFVRLGTTPKHFLADPALAVRLLGLDEQSLLSGAARDALGPQDGTILGRLFEGLVALSLQTYAQSSEARVSHFRSRNGDREVDFIVTRGDRRSVAFEVKLDRKVETHDVRHLHWLKAQLGDELADLVVVYCGDTAYRRDDGVAVIPAVLLGP